MFFYLFFFFNIEPFKHSPVQISGLERWYSFLPYFIILLSIHLPYSETYQISFLLLITSSFGLYGFHITIFPINSTNSLLLDCTVS